MPSLEISEQRKKDFAFNFIDAIISRSVEKCKALVLNYEEYTLLIGKDKKYTKDIHNDNLEKQCLAMINKVEHFLVENSEDISLDNLSKTGVYGLSEEGELQAQPGSFLQSLKQLQDNSDPHFIRTIKSISISMNEVKTENYQVHRISFQIDDLIVLDGEIRINNFLSVDFNKSYWKDAEAINRNFRSSVCKIDTFTNFLKQYPTLPVLSVNLGFKDVYIKLFSGDLTINSDLDLTGKDYSKYFSQDQGGFYEAVYILGNLTVNGNIYSSDDEGVNLYVKGNISANNIIVDEREIKAEGNVNIDNFFINPERDHVEMIAKRVESRIHFSELTYVNVGIDGFDVVDEEFYENDYYPILEKIRKGKKLTNTANSFLKKYTR